MKPVRSRVSALLPPQAGGTSAGSGFMVRLRWTYLASGCGSECQSFAIDLPIDQASYQRASNELAFAPWVPEHYAAYSLNGPMEEIRQLAGRVRELTVQRGHSALEEVANVISLVRSLRYWNDPDHPHAVDQPKYPVQTLVDGGGDCEDFAILAASILCVLGHAVALLYVETESTAHMALGYGADGLEDFLTVTGPDGVSYAYIEAVPTELELGAVPDEFLAGLQGAVVVPIVYAADQQGGVP